MEKEQVKQLQGASTGTLRISEEVLSTIATKAANSVEGVAGLKSGKSAVSQQGKKEKKKLFGRFDRPVRIEMSEDEAVLELHLIVRYGANIQRVSEMVQRAVKDDIQTMTGVTVSKVNIHIEDILFEEQL